MVCETMEKEEIFRRVENIMNTWFTSRQCVRANFWHIPMDWSCPGVLQTITAHQKRWMPLHRMVSCLESGCRFAFWKTVFENRNSVPQEDLLRVWYSSLADYGSISYQRVTTERGFEEYNAEVGDPEMQRNSVITDPLLIDNPIVSFRYCQVRKPGWEMLRYIHGRRRQTLRLSDAMRQAISEDCVPAFAMHLDMSARSISFSLLMEVLESGAVGIFRHLLENQRVTNDVITPSELCCLLVARFQDDISVPMLSVMDELHPGVVKGVVDLFGRNLLWYAVQNLKTGWFHPDCKLTPFLLEHGCDPRNENQIGLAWQTVTDKLPMSLRKQMMRKRYNWENYKAPHPYLLQLSQPLWHLNLTAGQNSP